MSSRASTKKVLIDPAAAKPSIETEHEAAWKRLLKDNEELCAIRRVTKVLATEVAAAATSEGKVTSNGDCIEAAKAKLLLLGADSEGGGGSTVLRQG